ncbi:cell division protein FtsZ [Patescibacteria group bacterium]
MPEIKPEIETFARIKVVGVGGSGCAAINRMVRSNIKGVDFLAVNTDLQALRYSEAGEKLHIGKSSTRGLGAGMNPEVGRKAAEENQNELRDALKGADMVFITCGLGGGTGTGAAPIVAEIAKDLGALTVSVVTKPFSFEGMQRKGIADSGLDELNESVDSIITIQNDRILQIIDKKTSLLDAFAVVDEVLKNGVQGISELITMHGLINVDFADVKSIMSDTGSALMGIGYGSGDNRAIDAAKAAVSSPLLDLSIEGAKGILFSVSGNANLSMHEVNEAAKIITNSADSEAKIIFGATLDENLDDEVKITVIATGFEVRNKKTLPMQPDFSGDLDVSSFSNHNENDRFKAKDLKKIQSEVVKNDEIKKQNEEAQFNKDRIDSNVDNEKENSNVNNESEDLDVPAFLRKKML